jgi:hypothetical protein
VKSHQPICGTLEGADHSAVGTEAPQPRPTDNGRPARGKAHYRFISEWGPHQVKTDTNPGGLPLSVFDGLRGGIAGNRELYYKDVAVPFLGYNKAGAKVPDGVTEQFWRRGMQSSAIGSSTASRSTLERPEGPQRRLSAGATRRATTDFAATAPGRARVPSAPLLAWLLRCPAYSPSRGTCS